MSEKLTQALKALLFLLQQEAHEHCTSVNVFINCEGYDIDFRTRTPDSLKRDGISMRNLKGYFIN